ncbi:MAG: hypothetical protein K8R75_00400 [Deltaproteobacteria bacterium]|nr:hypothetical protein [Deltaproteobacteria bacterium]
MSVDERPKMPASQLVYGEIVYWVTVVAALLCSIGPFLSIKNVDNNILNPHFLFAGIFEGKSPEAIWQEVGGGFPGGHFYLNNFGMGDGFTQAGLALGCSVGIYGLIAASFCFLKEKNTLFFVLSLWVTLLICVSMIGIV